jgi:UPF0755 protein
MKNFRPLHIVVSVIVITFIVLMFFSTAPSAFPRGQIVTIEKASTVTQVGEELAVLGIIRSPFLYKVFVTLFHGNKGVQAGTYLFATPQTVISAAYRTAYGVRGMEKIKITIPEGSSSREMAAILSKTIEGFDGAAFHDIAHKKEGYLFPDTYFFDQGVTPTEVVHTMTTVFDEKIATIKDKLATSTHSLKEIIIMASIVEEEENNSEDRRLISGILWKRIAAGMPLQVDAPFYYLYGKGSSQISKEDLAAASPYNTYKNKGLPVGPISNPGLDSIIATLEPVKSPYWFYLGDRSGQTHYAIDHDGHVANKNRYLR